MRKGKSILYILFLWAGLWILHISGWFPSHGETIGERDTKEEREEPVEPKPIADWHTVMCQGLSELNGPAWLLHYWCLCLLSAFYLTVVWYCEQHWLTNEAALPIKSHWIHNFAWIKWEMRSKLGERRERTWRERGKEEGEGMKDWQTVTTEVSLGWPEECRRQLLRSVEDHNVASQHTNTHRASEREARERRQMQHGWQQCFSGWGIRRARNNSSKQAVAHGACRE